MLEDVYNGHWSWKLCECCTDMLLQHIRNEQRNTWEDLYELFRL